MISDHYHPRKSDYMTMEDTNKSLDMGKVMIQDTHVAPPRSLHQGVTTDTIHDPFLKTLLVLEEASTSSLSGSVSGSISGSEQKAKSAVLINILLRICCCCFLWYQHEIFFVELFDIYIYTSNIYRKNSLNSYD